MNAVSEVIQEFGRSVGIEALRPDNTGRVSLAMGTSIRMEFHAVDHTILILLIFPGKTPAMELALQLCHVQHGWPFPVRAGSSRNGDLVICAYLASNELRVDRVEHAVQLLVRIHSRIST